VKYWAKNRIDMSAFLTEALLVADPAAGGTGLILFSRTESLPAAWVGPVPATGLEPGDVAALLAAARSSPCCLSTQKAGSAGWACRGARPLPPARCHADPGT
jgi:hypothetical protein